MLAPSKKKSLFSGNLIAYLVRFICLSSTSVSAKSVFKVKVSLFKISISRPESSAKQITFFFFKKCLYFMIEF